MGTLTSLYAKVLTKPNYKTLSSSRLTQLSRSDQIGFSPFASLRKKSHFDRLILVKRSADAPLLVTKAHATTDAEVFTGFETPASGNQRKKLSQTVHLKFQLQKECKFGEEFLLVGDDPMIGLWDPSNAIPLNWSEGHVWNVELDVRVDLTVQYKFILKQRDGEIAWQPGPDRIFKTWGNENTLVITEDWENAEAQRITEEQGTSIPDLQSISAGNDSHQLIPNLQSFSAGNVSHQEGATPDVNDLVLSGNMSYAENNSNGKYEVVNNIAHPVEGQLVNANSNHEPEESIGNRNEVLSNNNNCRPLTSKNPVSEEEDDTLCYYEGSPALATGFNPLQAASTEEPPSKELESIIDGIDAVTS